MKKILFLALLATAFFSCSKDPQQIIASEVKTTPSELGPPPAGCNIVVRYMPGFNNPIYGGKIDIYLRSCAQASPCPVGSYVGTLTYANQTLTVPISPNGACFTAVGDYASLGQATCRVEDVNGNRTFLVSDSAGSCYNPKSAAFFASCNAQ